MMSISNSRHRPFLAASLVLAAAWLSLGPVHADLPNVIRIVLQKGRQFDPRDLFLRRGDTIVLVNGDENAVHHAFIEANQFAFDAGDQEPGKHSTLVLRKAGDFVIQCGIHPKMKLTLHVQ